MIPRLSTTRLLSPADIEPSRDDFEVIGVFNPGVICIADDVLMLARIAERPLDERLGLSGLLRWTADGDCVIEWVADDELLELDPRVVRTKSDGCLRLTSVSHLRVYRRKRGSAGKWLEGPRLRPSSPVESYGIEDARITQIDQTYWITYVAASPSGVATALASSEDMLSFERHGLIFPPENKDVVLFPKKMNGHFYALHRPNPSSRFSPPQIWLARSHDLIHWGQHAPLLAASQMWEGDRIGAGTPPILIDEGWLVVYHGCSRPASNTAAGPVGIYSAGLVLLDRDNPSRVLARSSAPMMIPTTTFETTGFVPNVVFPTALIDVGDNIDIYYGAADTSIAVARFAKQAILESLSWN